MESNYPRAVKNPDLTWDDLRMVAVAFGYQSVMELLNSLNTAGGDGSRTGQGEHLRSA